MFLLAFFSFLGIFNFALGEISYWDPENTAARDIGYQVDWVLSDTSYFDNTWNPALQSIPECPPNSIRLRLNASICYSFHPSLSQYVIAERECDSFEATLVSLKNKYTSVYVTQLANLFFKHLEVEEFWSNDHRLIDGKSFQWTDGDEVEYINLANKRTEDNQDCMSVNLEKGFWKHENCFTWMPFVCEFVAENVKEKPPTALTFEKYEKFEMAPVKMRQYNLIEITRNPITTTTTTSPTKNATTTKPTACPSLVFKKPFRLSRKI